MKDKSYIYSRGTEGETDFYSVKITMADSGTFWFSALQTPKKTTDTILELFYAEAEHAMMTFQEKYENNN